MSIDLTQGPDEDSRALVMMFRFLASLCRAGGPLDVDARKCLAECGLSVQLEQWLKENRGQ